MKNTLSLLIKKELTDNRKPILLGIAGIWGTFILLGGFLGYTGTIIPVELFLFLFFSGMVLSIGASLAFSNMKTKEGRINTLMLPATVKQKFLVRWLGAVPLLFAVVLIGCFLGDWARLGMFRIMTHLQYFSIDLDPHLSLDRSLSAIAYISINLAEDPQPISFLITSVILGASLAQALYFLGAILWPKLSFIKTWAATQALQILGAIILVMCTKLKVPNFNSSDISFEGFMCFYIIFGLLICGGLYWLSYVRFRRSQVIYKLF